MVNITNGKRTLMVTKGAYESNFKPLGYAIVGSKTANAAKAPQNPSEGVVDGIEKPVSQWSKDELKHYADANGIELDSVHTIGDVREKVIAHQKSVNK